MSSNGSTANVTPLRPWLKPWPKGVSGNPAGRPKGCKDKLTNRFLEALMKDFEEHGEHTLARARNEEPLGYLNIIARLCPKELEIKRPLGDMTDDELHAGFEAIRSFVDSATDSGAAGDGDREPE